MASTFLHCHRLRTLVSPFFVANTFNFGATMRVLLLSLTQATLKPHGSWIWFVSNGIADALSRFQVQHFRELAPNADRSPCIIPPSLLTLWRMKSLSMLTGPYRGTQTVPIALAKNVSFNPVSWKDLWLQQGTFFQHQRGHSFILHPIVLAQFAKAPLRSTWQRSAIYTLFPDIRTPYKVGCSLKKSYGAFCVTRDPLGPVAAGYPQVLLAIRPILKSWLGLRDFSMIWSAFTLAFFAFLRCSEFTYPGVHSFSSRFNLTTVCVTFCPSLACPQHVLVTLKSSKTDVFRQGRSLIIARCSSLLCPISTMQQYFLLTQPPPGPLFSFRLGSLLKRSSVTHLLRNSAHCVELPYESLKGHSFRISAAPTAAATGLPDWLIKVLGCWSSDCYQIYIRTP